MIKVFNIWKKRINSLSANDRRSKLKEFAFRSVECQEAKDVFESLVEDHNYIYAGELYYYVALYSLKKKKDFPDIGGMINAVLDKEEDEIIRLVTRVLIEQECVNFEDELVHYLIITKDAVSLSDDKLRMTLMYKFKEEVLPYLCFPETSDNLFKILWVLYSIDFLYSKYFYIIINGWEELHGSTVRPTTRLGKECLIKLVNCLTNNCDFTCLNKIHMAFPILSEFDLYGKSFEEYISDVPQTLLDNPNSALYFLHSFKKTSKSSREGFDKWKKLYNKSSYNNEEWFKALSYVEDVNIDFKCLFDSKKDLPSCIKIYTPAIMINYEVVDVFAKILSEFPEGAFSFLKNITAINHFKYSDCPQIYSEIIQSPVKHLFLAKAFMIDFESRLLDYFSVRDFIRIYINSPLNQVCTLDDLVDRLERIGIDIDIERSPLSQVMFKGYIFYKDGRVMFRCSNISAKDLTVLSSKTIDNKDYDINAECQKGYHQVVCYLKKFVGHGNVELLGVTPVNINNEKKQYGLCKRYIKNKREKAMSEVTQIYEDYEKTGVFSWDRLLERITIIENAPILFDFQNKKWRDKLCIAQTKAFLAAAKNEEELSDILSFTNKIWGGCLNMFRNDPFGQNTTRFSEEEYKNVRQELLEGNPLGLDCFLRDTEITAKSLFYIYFNTIIKRIIPIERFFSLLKEKINTDDSEEVYSEIKSSIFVGKVYYYDKDEHVAHVKPNSFNHGKTKFVYHYKRFVPINQTLYFTIDKYDGDKKVCVIRTLSTRDSLLKNMPKEAFKSALMASVSSVKFFRESELKEILKYDNISGLFEEFWYENAFRSYFNSHIYEKMQLAEAITLLGNNNAFLNDNMSMNIDYRSFETDKTLYEDYITTFMLKKNDNTLSDLVYVFMNSPMKMVVSVDYLVNKYVELHDSYGEILIYIMQYTIMVESVINNDARFYGAYCEKYRFEGDPTVSRYFVSSYDSDSHAFVLRKIGGFDRACN